ncbi:MAG: ArsR family transcriptional regulator [Bifidobacteriaceae bacterium]|jgi:DNA-binding transcriptional ArsR family regulator|nr:ArsR family transcriptional regulator [Bifidobacteriaceae bacterium]
MGLLLLPVQDACGDHVPLSQYSSQAWLPSIDAQTLKGGNQVPTQLFHPSLSTIDPTSLLRAASDPVRLMIVQILDEHREQTCSELADQLSVPLPTMSHHLKTLREAGITLSRKEGTTRWTSLRRPELDLHFPGLIEQLVALAGRLAQSKDAYPRESPATVHSVDSAPS